MRQNRILFLLICLFAVILLVGVVHADLFSPAITHVYFDKDGVPYYGIVHYTITCYGYTTDYRRITLAPGSYTPEPSFRYSATCNGYGCSVYQPYYFQHTYIDWCDLEGVADNQNFTIKDIFPFSRCDYVAGRDVRDFGTYPREDYIRKYYYATPEYESCIFLENKTWGLWMATGQLKTYTVYGNNFSTTNTESDETMILQLPGRDLLYAMKPGYPFSINRSDIHMSLADYIAYLETCKTNSDPLCPGYLVEGKPLKSFPGYRSLKMNATSMKNHPCDTFLVDTDPSLIMPFTEFEAKRSSSGSCDIPCNITGQICEARFSIPSVGDSVNTDTRTSSTTPTIKITSPSPTKADQENKNVRTTSTTSVLKKDSIHPSTTSHANTSITKTSVVLTPEGTSNTHRSPVESLFCSILSRLDISCDSV
jgi:hypothetical protein